MNLDLNDPEHAEAFVLELLAEQPERLRHSLVIAERVRQTARDINELNPHLCVDESFAYCAALLHDIGYAPALNHKGFHPLDAYDFLTAHGFTRLAQCVVGHSCALEEARLIGFELPASVANDIPSKLLTYWDMQVEQGGEIVSYEKRLAGILSRYGKESQVVRANIEAKPRIQNIIKEIKVLLREDPL